MKDYFSEEIEQQDTKQPVDYFSKEINAIPPEQPSQNQPFLPGIDKVNQLEKTRQDPVETLRQEVNKPYSGNILQKTIKAGITGLKAINVPISRLESGLVGAGMAVQKNEQWKDVGQELVYGLSGEKHKQFGDIIRATGFGGPTNEAISATAGVGASMKTMDIGTLGNVTKSVKNGEEFIKAFAEPKLPKIMPKTYVLDRVKEAVAGIDELYKAVGSKYDELFGRIGKMQITPQNQQIVTEILSELPETVLNKISKSKLVSKTVDGKIAPDMENLKAIRGIIRKGVPEQVWNGRAIGTPETAVLEQAYGKIGKVMAGENPELVSINEQYSKFRTMQKELHSILLDTNGNPVANPLQNLLKDSGEQGKLQFFQEFAEQWPRAKQILKDVNKFNTRQTVKKLTGIGAGLSTGGVLGYEIIRRKIERPLIGTMTGN
jgi:hypothetical protein